MANSVVRPHVPEEELHAYCDGELSPPQRVEIAEHLLGCLICRAQHAEVEAVRVRASELLAYAVPARARRVGAQGTRVASVSRRWPRVATTIAAALVGVGVWFSLKPEVTGAGTSQIASSFGMPGFGRNDVDSAGLREKQLAMAARTNTTPSVVSLRDGGTAGQRPALGTPADVDPVFTSEWTATNLDSAVKIGEGSLARVSGVPVAIVRIHPSAIGGRPTFMVRQQLQDGRPIWVFEGLEADIAPVNQVLQASGIAMSMVTRTKPDYVGAGADSHITTRMVTVVGYLSVDSLNTLVSKLTLR